MENKKTIVILLFLLSTVSCSAKDCVHIKDGVYKSQFNNEVYFRLLNKKLKHPKIKKQYKRFVYKNDIGYKDDYKKLRDLVDIETIERLDIDGTYFQDKNYFYVYATRPISSPQFFLIDKKNAHFMFDGFTYLKTDEFIYSYGNIIHGLDVKTAEFFNAKDSNDVTHEFIKDKDHLFWADSKIGIETICMFDIDKELKKKLVYKYFSKSDLSACKPYPLHKFDKRRRIFVKKDDLFNYPKEVNCQ